MGCTASLIDSGFAQRMCEAQDKMERQQREAIIKFLKHENNVHVRIMLRVILNSMMIETVATSGPEYYFTEKGWLEQAPYENEGEIGKKSNCMIEFRINPFYESQIFYFINSAFN